MLLQQIEQFSRHHGAERNDAAVRDPDPFVVRAGMADERVIWDQVRRERAQQLDLFAAHHVRFVGVLEANARHDCGATFFRPNERTRQVLEPGRAPHVGSVDPAAVRPDHSGEQQRPVAEPLANFSDRCRESAASN